MTARQLAFPQPRRDAQGRDDLMVTPSNARALALLEGWARWPDSRLALIGPEASGKSHLAAIWADLAGARVLAAVDLAEADAPDLARAPIAVEDADRGVDEAALFHLWNACARTGAPLLLTGRAAPTDWPVSLPDLRSRLTSLTPAVIEDPDDALLGVLLVKLFADRQIAVRPGLVGWLLRRIERSHRAARDAVAQLDAAALVEGRPVDERLARDVLDKPGAAA